jgi:UDP-N-acetylmuramoyl-L-alanyl-D-glutamate--2,6-diaminopimelate ligase
MMGAVASKLADECIITSDNPRTESPKAIIDAILFGVEGEHKVIEDRALAITRAVGIARAIDTVLVAGKGHEDYQEINGVKQPFSDSEVVRRALSVWAPAINHPEWITT